MKRVYIAGGVVICLLIELIAVLAGILWGITRVRPDTVPITPHVIPVRTAVTVSARDEHFVSVNKMVNAAEYQPEAETSGAVSVPDTYETNPAEVEALAKTVWGEARGLSADEWRLVVWCVLQRVDDSRWPDTVEGVVMQPGQFHGYAEGNPVDPDIYEVCAGELARWAAGVAAAVHEEYAPTAPYYYFEGFDGHNWFREIYKSV